MSERNAGERRARRRAEAAGVAQPQWSRFVNPLPPLALADEEALARIEATALRILDELGLEFMSVEAQALLARSGARVDRDSGIVRFEPALLRELVAKAPQRFTLHARNPARDLVFGGANVNFGPVGGPPNVADRRAGRRPGTHADQVRLIKLHQALTCLHLTGTASVEAQDLPAESRHLDLHRAQVVHADRVWQARGIGRARVRDALEIAARARGVERGVLPSAPSLLTVINTNSPRRVDKELIGGLIEMAENGQACCVTPFTLAGAMSPITLAGALAQQAAEALGVIALVQAVRPGAPVLFGGFTSNVDMRSGAPAFGTAEYVQATIIGGQFARRWRLPYRASNVTAAGSVDAQATWEAAMSLWASVMSHANFVHHATGWLEGGLTASLEKSVLDAELIGILRAALAPLDVSDAALAFEAIRDVPPGGHFFGAPHTMARFESAFHPAMLGEVKGFEAWVEAGRQGAAERATAVAERLLANHVDPPLDPARLADIDDYVARRKSEIARRGLEPS